MLKFIRQRLFRASSLGGRDALQAWAESSGWTMRNSRDRDGFIIDARAGQLEGRIEWGPSQRHYMGPHELRLRGELPALSGEAHALVMPRMLLDSVEAELFNQFVGGVQTRMDEETPEEMRWLALSPKLSGALLGELKAHYAAVSNRVPWLAHWLQGPLGELLLQRALGPAEAAPPFALIVQRNRLTLRVALPEPDVASVQAAQALFAMALTQARVTADEPSADDEGPSTQ
ncbi:MAG TPA: hypothetical protein VFY73_05050 [Ideonella sp.]|uniref:hypothetical protein n=1 Tax=Ideonella sp. TaxID=1929293 RepID=UPI002E309E0D|nr:hypothetical protein [Ideonella sp.]HEX5683384.1 hypothetical protein [Ideonella sp.]